MAKMYDLVAKVGEYTDQQGNKKGRFQRIGAMMEGHNGGSPFIMIEKWFNPAGVLDFSGKNSGSVLISCYEPTAGDTQGGQQAPAGQKPLADDDMPF